LALPDSEVQLRDDKPGTAHRPERHVARGGPERGQGRPDTRAQSR